MTARRYPAEQFFDNNGNVLNGGKINTYAAGTTTPRATYTDSTLGTARSNPIVLDSAGRATGGIWLDSALGKYKFVIDTSADVTLDTIDNIEGEGTGTELLNDLDVNGKEIKSISSGNIEIHSDNDVNIHLGDAAGVDDLNIKDSAGSTVASINSDGDASFTDVTLSGALSIASLTVDNVTIDGNTISSTSGNLIIDAPASSDVRVNNAEIDSDFIVRSQAGTNLLFCDASTAEVGIGTGAPDQLLHVRESTSTDDAISAKARLTHVTSGTPQDGIGTGLEWEIETTAGEHVICQTAAVAADVSSGTEDGDFVIELMEAGASVAERARLTSTGNWQITGSVVSDGITLSNLLWVEAVLDASTLDSAGTETILTAGSGDRFKIRDMMLLGGGTNFAAGGDRNIEIKDATTGTSYSIIPNAQIESLPSTTSRWGETALPFPGTASNQNVATGSGENLVAQYQGGTTDHSGTGSLTVMIQLEKVA